MIIIDFKFIILKAICLVIISLIILSSAKQANYIKVKKDLKKKNNNSNILINNSFINNKNAYNDGPDFLKFQNMFPFLYKNYNSFNIPLKKEDLFTSRQIYISEARITPDYIKFIRSINETDKPELKKKLKKKEIIIDNNIYKKRIDQYKYTEFCELALNEKLLNYTKLEKNYEPIISIILPVYNKQNLLLKSIRSIQNQNFKNLEIIIINDFSTDNSTGIFNYLLETDSRIRIFHHMKNLGSFKSRLDGILYSKGKYIILFDPGDFYEDNYVLLDAYNIIEKYNLDSCKFIYRHIRNYNKLNKSAIYYHAGSKAKIVYDPENIKNLDIRIFRKSHAIWNRLVRSDIYIKGILLFNELTLNVYKNLWDDIWYNEIVNRVSYSYTIIERIGYVYYVDGKGEGTPKYRTKNQKSNLIKEYVAFLYFDLNFYNDKKTKVSIIKKLRNYNGADNKRKLKNFINHFEVLNNLLEALIKDPDVNGNNRKFCEKLLIESKIREKNHQNN